MLIANIFINRIMLFTKEIISDVPWCNIIISATRDRCLKQHDNKQEVNNVFHKNYVIKGNISNFGKVYNIFLFAMKTKLKDLHPQKKMDFGTMMLLVVLQNVKH